MKNTNLIGFNALITGGNKGIGKAISLKLVEAGANVISLGRTDIDNNSHLYKEYSDNFFHYKCDISNIDVLNSTMSLISENHKKINILINNAGILDFSEFSKSDISIASKILQVNLTSAITLTHHLLPSMLNSKSGMIINISSIGAIENFAGCSVYNASKAGLLSFSRSLRNEVRTSGLKIIDIIPGATLTDIWDSNSRELFKDNMMLPSDLAEIIYSCIILSLNDRVMIEEVVVTPQNGSL